MLNLSGDRQLLTVYFSKQAPGIQWCVSWSTVWNDWSCWSLICPSLWHQ